VKWEYMTLKIETTGWTGGKFDEFDLDARLNELGRQGWELATAFDTNQIYGETRYMVFTFKRPRPA
jgi:hypothetical protein